MYVIDNSIKLVFIGKILFRTGCVNSLCLTGTTNIHLFNQLIQSFPMQAQVIFHTLMKTNK